MPTETVPPFPDVEAVAEKTSARELGVGVQSGLLELVGGRK